ncbi:acyltransferase [Sinorhizobium sp. BG8]|uniref:acyltransferase family protein n=1 Tax=Sinorhizobium sp. BG8 TaxID=2613773 RepID=UPI00193C8743|nr:acyltransferase [Sinorhizobium sp. BG8]QRM57935.1 acyltransferase [Sinorhizobium sp. BG8]
MDGNISARINFLRIVLISGIVLVHIPYSPATSPFLGAYGLFDWLRVFLGDSLFRIGVPCLSAISGYLLFYRGLAGFNYTATLRSKAVTILLPFLIWNLSFLLFAFAVQKVGAGHSYLPHVYEASPRELANLAFAIESWPINLPLFFLRDLLLCVVLSPVLAFLLKRYPFVTLAVLFIYAVFPVPNGIFLKKSIVFGFSLGIWASLHSVDVKKLDRFAPWIVSAVFSAAVLLSVGVYTLGPDFPAWLDVLRNLVAITGILGSWTLSSMIIDTRIGQRLTKTGGLSFWIFCGHYPVLVCFWMLWSVLNIGPYPAFYAFVIVATFAILIVSNNLARRWMPRVHSILTGSRKDSARGRPPGKPAAAEVTLRNV